MSDHDRLKVATIVTITKQPSGAARDHISTSESPSALRRHATGLMPTWAENTFVKWL
jgi:hypothetical protein